MGRSPWTDNEIAALKTGVQKHGCSAWADIVSDPKLASALKRRTNVNCKDKWRQLDIPFQQLQGQKVDKPRGQGQKVDKPRGDVIQAPVRRTQRKVNQAPPPPAAKAAAPSKKRKASQPPPPPAAEAATSRKKRKASQPSLEASPRPPRGQPLKAVKAAAKKQPKTRGATAKPDSRDFEKEAIDSAIGAMAKACCKHSKYQVGACLVTTGGALYTGINVESDSYGLCVCAERCALFKALSEGEKDFEIMACATKDAGISCGACRQLLSEYCPADMPVIFVNKQRVVGRRTTVTAMLPDPFILK